MKLDGGKDSGAPKFNREAMEAMEVMKEPVESPAPSFLPLVVEKELVVEEEGEVEVEEKPEGISLKEIISEAAINSVFYGSYFFPKTVRQEAAQFHYEVYAILDNPVNRYVNILLSRDAAKTTLLRLYLSKRIAFGLSRTILYVGASQDKAKQTVGWLKTQVEKNKRWASTFGLTIGKPGTDEHLAIIHGVDNHTVHVLAYGITGSVRGVNLEDYRPDMIVIDDCMTDENSSTDVQRGKVIELVLGALKESLSPRSETPDAKMVLLNTPQDFEDISQLALKDKQFTSASFGCWTKETEDLPIEMQESSWPARYPSEELRQEKRFAIARNKYSTFAREKEVKLITLESSFFKEEWLQFFGNAEKEPEPPRHEMIVEMVIDPVPPPSDMAVAKGAIKTDFEAFGIVGRWKNKYYVLEVVSNRGHDPNWTVATFFELALRWNPRKVIVESVAYQRTLIWLLKEAMKRTGRYWVVEEFKDRRAKFDRINDGISGPMSHMQLFFRKVQTTLISQVVHYPGKNPEGNHDDEIEVLAIALASLARGYVGDITHDHYVLQEEGIPSIEDYRGAP